MEENLERRLKGLFVRGWCGAAKGIVNFGHVFRFNWRWKRLLRWRRSSIGPVREGHHCRQASAEGLKEGVATAEFGALICAWKVGIHKCFLVGAPQALDIGERTCILCGQLLPHFDAA